ncbi:DNRLRE domain-containing protein [Marinilabiliaceae bacterium JC017]|nr:DNRLRE domain-containing protein [Marinilabiliaceae bacterium JC017]
MKASVKIFIASLFVFGATSNAFCAKPLKIKVSHDAFVQGGETANQPLGATKAARLRIGKSTGNDKYSRTTYLQFNLKKVENFESVDLNLCVKVYKSKEDASAKFQLQVYNCDDTKWKETSITFNTKPEQGELLATQSIGVTEKNEWVKISLPADVIKKQIKKSKKGKLTLVLYNADFNKTAAEIISKERQWTNGTPANKEAYLEFQ